jgi:16S rRNA (cytosine1402-N4)-methyltransferase
VPGRHVPVLREEAVRLLVTDRGGVYVDVTLGAGGHASAILDALGPGGRVIALDCDPDAVARALADPPAPPPRFLARRARFSELRATLSDLGAGPVDGLLADLGISSDQLEDPTRGLAFTGDGPLDMRLDPARPLDADAWIRQSDDRALRDALTTYGELPRAQAVVRAIRRAAEQQAPLTTGALRAALLPLFPGPARPRRLAQVFQALRIAVNRELLELSALLAAAPDVVKPGGTLCVISYHSLEDRLVKHAMRPPRPVDPRAPVPESPWDPITRRPLRPSDAECRQNPRARSARLRAARRKEGRP